MPLSPPVTLFTLFGGSSVGLVLYSPPSPADNIAHACVVGCFVCAFSICVHLSLSLSRCLRAFPHLLLGTTRRGGLTALPKNKWLGPSSIPHPKSYEGKRWACVARNVRPKKDMIGGDSMYLGPSFGVVPPRRLHRDTGLASNLTKIVVCHLNTLTLKYNPETELKAIRQPTTVKTTRNRKRTNQKV